MSNLILDTITMGRSKAFKKHIAETYFDDEYHAKVKAEPHFAADIDAQKTWLYAREEERQQHFRDNAFEYAKLACLLAPLGIRWSRQDLRRVIDGEATVESLTEHAAPVNLTPVSVAPSAAPPPKKRKARTTRKKERANWWKGQN